MKTSILYADDEIIFHELVDLILDKQVFDIEFAKDGSEAFDKVFNKGENNAYDVILMDIGMPVLSGDKSAEKIKQIFPNQYIIAMTAFDLDEFNSTPFDNYIRKPIQASNLNTYLLKIVDGIKGKTQ